MKSDELVEFFETHAKKLRGVELREIMRGAQEDDQHTRSESSGHDARVGEPARSSSGGHDAWAEARRWEAQPLPMRPQVWAQPLRRSAMGKDAKGSAYSYAQAAKGSREEGKGAKSTRAGAKSGGKGGSPGPNKNGKGKSQQMPRENLPLWQEGRLAPEGWSVLPIPMSEIHRTQAGVAPMDRDPFIKNGESMCAMGAVAVVLPGTKDNYWRRGLPQAVADAIHEAEEVFSNTSPEREVTSGGGPNKAYLSSPGTLK